MRLPTTAVEVPLGLSPLYVMIKGDALATGNYNLQLRTPEGSWGYERGTRCVIGFRIIPVYSFHKTFSIILSDRGECKGAFRQDRKGGGLSDIQMDSN
jgi:hypothetical protein